jgi:DMSO/TMAO reductase YedYZ molybdopterin-dependent catalytic subunit
VTAVKRLTVTPSPQFEAIEGLSPLITAPDDHYVIDINIDRPRVDGGEWTLLVHGEVERTLKLGFEEIVALGTEERAIYLQCISNIVGGRLMGNATWNVVPLSAVLALAGPLSSARTVVAQAYDGYHESYTLEEADEIFVAVAMGGLELTDDHGFPVRLLYPGHYGMRSIKWLTSLQLTDESRADNQGYWQERGWDDKAPLRLGSRIDAPGGGEAPPGLVVVAGVAWARSVIAAVEISVDDGATWPYQAELEPTADEHAWTRWRAELDLPPGEYEVRSRAVAGDEVQDAEWRDPHPSGSSGLDLKVIEVV